MTKQNLFNRFRPLCLLLALLVCLLSVSFLFGCQTGTDGSSEESAEPTELSPDEKVSKAQAKLKETLFGWTENTPLDEVSDLKNGNLLKADLEFASLSVSGQELPEIKAGFDLLRNGEDEKFSLGGKIGDTQIDIDLIYAQSVLYASMRNVTDKPIRISEVDINELLDELRPSGPEPDAGEKSADANPLSKGDLDDFRTRCEQMMEDAAKTFGEIHYTESVSEDGSAVYTKAIDKETIRSFAKRVYDLFKDFADKSGIPLKEESADGTGLTDPEKDDSFGSIVLKETLKDGELQALEITINDAEGKAQAVLGLNVSKSDAKTTVQANLRNAEKTVLECTFSVEKSDSQTETAVSVTVYSTDEENANDEINFKGTLRWTGASKQSVSYAGDVSFTQKTGGVIAGITVSVDGKIDRDGDKLDATCHIVADGKDLFKTDATVTLSWSKTDGAIAAPADSVSFQDVMKDPSDLVNKLIQAYPFLNSFAGPDGGFEENTAVQTFMTEDEEIAIYFDYAHNAAVISAFAVYEDTGDAFLLSNPSGTQKDRIPYTLGTDGTITIFGRELDVFEEDGEKLFYRDGVNDFHMELFSDGYAFVYLAFPRGDDWTKLNVQTGGSQLFTLSLIWAEDGSSFQLKDGTTFAFAGYEDAYDPDVTEA